MKYRLKSKYGEVIIDGSVIANFAGTAAVECFGVVGMASTNVKDGIVNLLKKEHLAKGIKVTENSGRVCLDFHIIVSYGVSISAVSKNLTETVRYKVEEFLGTSIGDINVFVEGVRVID